MADDNTFVTCPNCETKSLETVIELENGHCPECGTEMIA